MRTRLAALGLIVATVGFAQPAPPTTDALTLISSGNRKIVKRWALPGDPRGVAIGSDGTVYVGVAEPQAVLAIDPKSGVVKHRLVLDSAEIASTKELVTLRTNPERTRLYIANGSDESATILRLPDLAVLREITMEGETIRDMIPDPRGRYVYLLGREVHVFDAEGDTEVRTLVADNPMAIAASANGAMLAVLATEDFGSAKATVVTLFDTNTFAEIARDPLQTEKSVEAAMFAAGDRSIIAFSRDAFFEKRVTSRPTRITESGNTNVAMRVAIGDLVNSTHICLPARSGAQVATLTSTDALLVYAERRCSASGTFSGSNSGVTPASLYGINAYAVAYDRLSNTIVATDREGFLTIYQVPRPATVSR
ncbi:MAG: hypothetical protein M3P06_13855 [Acidobacteriota bacterium]|nr:hypothetical protein [Acidobacteriota bacterium]